MNKTRIFIDVSALPDVGKAVTGISRVILSLVKHIATEHPDLIVQGISFREDNESYKLWKLTDIIQQVNGLLSDIKVESQEITEPVAGDFILLLGEQWLFPRTFPVIGKLKVEREIKIVCLIHDLVPFFMPELYWDDFPVAYIDCITRLVDISDVILVNSNSTSKDLLKYFPSLNDGFKPIHQVRLGDVFYLTNQVAQKPDLPDGVHAGNFILCVSTIQPRKNHLQLLAVWRQMLECHGESCPPLLLIGKQGWHVDDLMYFIRNSPLLNKKVHIFEQVSDQELQWIYQNCMFSVYPSLYEGWGLPIGESLAAHRFCLSSNSSSMPEVGGHFVDYFSPHDSGELYRIINKYFTNPDQLMQKENNIREQFSETTWSTTTNQIINAIKSVN